MPKAWLSKSAATLKSQIDAAFQDRDRASDGWLGDAKHQSRKSDHNPDSTGCVRAIDVDADLNGRGVKPDLMPYFADQLRIYAKNDKRARITYLIFNGRIASKRFGWRWRKYSGINPHKHHLHISFAETADLDTTPFAISLLGENK